MSDNHEQKHLARSWIFRFFHNNYFVPCELEQSFSNTPTTHAMTLATQSWIKNAIASLQLLQKHPILAVLVALLDAGFFFLIGALTTPVFNKLVEYVVVIASQLPQASALDVSAYRLDVALLFLSAILITYVLYILLHGTAWWLVKKMNAGKQCDQWYVSLRAFARVNILWFVAYAGLLVFDMWLSLRNKTIEVVTKAPADNVLGIMIFFASAIVFLLALLTYPTNRLRDLGSIIRAWRHTLPCMALIVVVALVLDFLVNQATVLNWNFGLFAGFVLILPFFVWARTYITKTVLEQKVLEVKHGLGA